MLRATLCLYALRFLIVVVALLQTQAFQPDHRLTQLLHKSWQTEQGLPQNAVYCLTQDHDGFLWFGTENGLVRFDGLRFDVFTETSNPPVPHNFASSLLVAKDGTLWVGTRTGGFWRRRSGEFEVPFAELADAHVLALAETDDGTIWAGTSRGLFRVAGNSATNMALPWVEPTSVTALEAIDGGALLVGARSGEVFRIDQAGIRSVLSTRGMAGGGIKALEYDAKTGDLWIARDGAGLHLLRTNSLTHIDILPDRELDYLQALHLDPDGALWIGTMEGGVIRYFKGEISGFSLAEGLPDADVLSVLKDRDGSVWVGTHYGGLNRLLEGKAATFTRREGLPASAVSCVLRANLDSLWIGTSGDGLLVYSHCQFTPVVFGGRSEANDIRALHQRGDGELWIGTHGAGLVRYRTNKAVRFFTTSDGLAEDFVTTIFERRNGELWIGSIRGGITVLDLTDESIRTPQVPGFLRTHIRSIAEDSKGTVWIGTQNGLVRFTGGEFAPVHLKEAPDLSVRHLVCESDDTLWIASRDNGLLRMKSGRVDRYDARVGLRHNRIYQIVTTSEDLWLAGNQGIERVSRAELSRIAQDADLHLTTQLYTKNEGLRTAESGGDFSPSATADAQGVLWFGTKGGLVRIDPARSRRFAQPPKVLITSLTADNQQIAPGPITRLKPGTTRLQFDYTALSLRNPANVFFKYKMDRVDPDWVDAGGSREAVYYNLKPGSYRFQVLACNDEGLWNEQGALLAFSIAPHFYQTVWFRGVAGLGLVSGLTVAYRSRVRGMRSRNRELATLVAARTKALQTEVEHRTDAENRLRLLNEELETRVKERTLELRNAYENLEIELHERHEAEQALARSEARLRRVVESGMVGIAFWHKDGSITEANNTFLSLLGYSREELEQGQLSWQKLTPPDQLHFDAAALEEIQKTGVCAPFEKEYLRKDGTRVPVLLGGASLSADSEKGVCFVLDISQRKASEEEVRRLNLLLEARVKERTTELALANEQLASEVQERKRVAVALAAFSHLGQKLHSARTEKEAATIVAETARTLIPHDVCSIELYDLDGCLRPVLAPSDGGSSGSQAAPRCAISVSIRNGTRVVGILGLKSSKVHGFTHDDANTLQALGDYCGGALERIHAEEARRELERRFSTFMRNAPALAWMKDAQFRYVFTNEAFQRFTGLSAIEIEGKTDFELWPESIAAHMREDDAATKDTQSKRETQERLKRHDGETRTLLTLRFLFTTGTGEQYVAGMAIDITEQKRAEEALHRLPHSILDAQETERRRVARELHDGVNQAIASIKFRIQTAEQQILRADPKWQETCGKTKEMLDSVLQQVRRLSRNLRPGELDDFGLVPAARSACQEMEWRTGVTVKFTHSEFEERLPAALELSLYRIIQEALTNVEKHASATEVSIDLQEDGAYVLLEITDNGCGFDMAAVHGPKAGLGLLHMRERASLVGGVFSAASAPGQGVRINIHAPIQRAGEDQ